MAHLRIGPAARATDDVGIGIPSHWRCLPRGQVSVPVSAYTKFGSGCETSRHHLDQVRCQAASCSRIFHQLVGFRVALGTTSMFVYICWLQDELYKSGDGPSSWAILSSPHHHRRSRRIYRIRFFPFLFFLCDFFIPFVDFFGQALKQKSPFHFENSLSVGYCFI